MAETAVTVVVNMENIHLLKEVFDQGKTLGALGFDIEGVDLCRTGRACVIQVATDDKVYLFDVVEGGKELIEKMRELLESPEVVKIVHDCRRDAEALFHQYGVQLTNVFDTQIAYRQLHQEENGECVSFVQMLKEYCGVDYKEKGVVHQLHDQDNSFWTVRPFTEQMMRCAAMDVRYLPAIHRQMAASLDARGVAQVDARSRLYLSSFAAAVLQSPPEDVVTKIGDFDGLAPDEDSVLVLRLVPVPDGRMGRIIGKQGCNIKTIKECCAADIFLGGKKGPANLVFVLGFPKQVELATAMVRGYL